MKTHQVIELSLVVLVLGLGQGAQADGFNRGVDDCRLSNRGDRSALRSCLESGRDRILSALSEIGDGGGTGCGGGTGQPGTGSGAGAGFVPDRSLSSDLASRTGVAWGEIVFENGRLKEMTQYQAFEYCLSLNRDASMRRQIVRALGYAAQVGRRTQNLAHRQMTDSEQRDRLRRLPAGAIYLPARTDFANVRAHEFGDHWLWSSSGHRYQFNLVYYFYGRGSSIDVYYGDYGRVNAVRCVRR